MSDLGRESLVSHMLTQVVSRASAPGKSGQLVGEVDGSNYFQGVPRIGTNFWLLDVTNILARSLGVVLSNGIVGSGTWMTPVSPRITITCGHTGGNWAGHKAVWIRADGTFITNTVLQSYTYFPNGGADMTINFMEQTNHLWLKYFPLRLAKEYVCPGRSIPVITFRGGNGQINSVHRWHIPAAGCYFVHGYQEGFYDANGYSQHNVYAGVYPGDSGNPQIVVVSNQAVLFGILSGFVADTQLARLNAAMSLLCQSNNVPIETMTAYDLSRFTL